MKQDIWIKPIEERYPPTKFEHCFGNTEEIKRIERQVLKEGGARVFLLYGSYGIGKTSTANVIAEELGSHPISDRIVYSAEDYKSRKFVMQLRLLSQLAPCAKKRVIILDEADCLNKTNQKELLKILQKPSPRTVFILCTVYPAELLSEVKSRCRRYHLQPLKPEEMKQLLERVVKKEAKRLKKKGHELKLPNDLLEKIADESKGMVREALQLLDEHI